MFKLKHGQRVKFRNGQIGYVRSLGRDALTEEHYWSLVDETGKPLGNYQLYDSEGRRVTGNAELDIVEVFV